MKKIKEFIKRNLKVIVAFIKGIMVSGIGVYAATILYNANEIGYDNTNVAIKKNNVNVTNVQDAIEVLYEKAKGPCAFKLGDYISLTPTATSFTIKTETTGYSSDQTINPSELILWRVIDIHSDGSFDAVSEYVSSTDVYFQGATGYANFVGGLQTIAASYAKTGYTISTRMMGYGGQTPTIADTRDFDGTYNPNDNPDVSPPSTTSTPNPTTVTGDAYKEYSEGVLGDTLYLKDYLLVENVYGNVIAQKVGTTTDTGYWLASRKFNWFSASNFGFNGRCVNTSGNLIHNFFRVRGGTWTDGTFSNSVRPILTLKSGITIRGGAGTKAIPYTIS